MAFTLVVETDDVEGVGHRRAGTGGVHGGGYRAGLVFGEGNAAEHLGGGAAKGGRLLIQLVADAPGDDGWVIAVTADEGAKIRLMPVGEDGLEVIAGFVDAPRIENLIDDHEAHLVGEVEELGRRWVV